MVARDRALVDMGSMTCSPGGDVGLELRVRRGVVVMIKHCSYRHFGGVAKSMGGIDNIDWGALIEGPVRGGGYQVQVRCRWQMI